MTTPGKASLPVIKRLPKYYRYLRNLKHEGITSISSRELAAQMGTTASQVRQDFNCIGDVNGRQGIGYSVENLLSILEHLLFGDGDLLPTILIGCGRLGKAVSRFITTDTNGYKLIAAFDNSPEEVGKEISGIQILNIDQLEEFCTEHHPEVAVLCLPRSGAEELSSRLVSLGIQGFWNFSHYDLSIPYPEVVVENVHLGDSLMSLGYRLREPGLNTAETPILWIANKPSPHRAVRQALREGSFYEENPYHGKTIFPLRRHEQRQEHGPDAGGAQLRGAGDAGAHPEAAGGHQGRR